MEKLRRAKKGRKIAGVCAGIGRLIGLDASYVRLLWLALALVPPFNHLLVLVGYALLAWIVPVADKETEAGQDVA